MLLLNKKILITGSSGFVGQGLIQKLHAYPLVLLGRREGSESIYPYFRAEITAEADFSEALAGVSVVIHCAARAHIMNDSAADPLKAFREINTFGTLNLARQAAAAGVRRFIFISTIKVNGESTDTGKPFRSDDEINPQDAYAVSKAEAESGLKQLAYETGMELVIIRPPLIYGPGVKANFVAMLRLAKRNLPVPFGAIHNKRSMLALDNLVDLIEVSIDHPKAANQTFLVSDDRDLSTTELLQLMVRAYGKTPRLIPVPMSWFNIIGKLTGKQAVIARLCGNLQVDINDTKTTLNWRPPVSVEDGIKSCIPKEDLC
ncbi:MAG: UDP-glucose 4-epimerase family protein [Alishewanella aestuarii]